jgi:copper transport protein
VCLVAVASADAHASLRESDPEPNAVIAEAPDAVTMRFTEPLERGSISAQLFDQQGAAVPATEARAGSGAYEMVLELPPDLPDGTYSVFWRTLSTADGHPAQNYFTFTIGTDADVAAASVPPGKQSGAGPPQWAVTGSRWAALVGLAALVAAWPVWVGIVRPAVRRLSRSGPRITRLMRRFGLIAAVVAAVGSLIALMVQAMSLSDGTLLDQMLNTLGHTRYGHMWLVRMGLIVLLGLALAACDWRTPRRRPLLAGAAGLGSLALPVPFSLMSHASAQTAGRTVAVAADALHLLAASLWGGGLIVLAVVVLPALRRVAPKHRRAVLAVAIPRFSILALVSWAAMGVTGFYAGWLQVGSWDALRSTAYGQALLIKLALLVGILALAAVNMLLLQRRIARSSVERTPVWSTRLRWTVGAEAALLLGVLLVVGQMTSLEPARAAVAQERESVSIRFELDGGTAHLRLTPGTAGLNAFHLEVADNLVSPETRPVLKITLPAREGMTTKDLHLSRAPDGTFAHRGSELGMPGEWAFELVLREQGSTPVSASTVQAIASTSPDADRSGAPWRFAPVGGLAGLLLTLVGIGGTIVAVVARTSRLRVVSGGIGAVGLMLGIVLLVQARIDPGPEASEMAAVDPGTATVVAREKALDTELCLACQGADRRGDGWDGGVEAT